MATIFVFAYVMGCVGSVGLIMIHITMVMKHRERTVESTAKRNPRSPQTHAALLSSSMKILTTLSVIGFSISILLGGLSTFACIPMLGIWTPIFYQLGKCCIYIDLIMRILYLYSDLEAVGLNTVRYTRFIDSYKFLLVIGYVSLGTFGSLTIEHDEQSVFGGLTVCGRVHDQPYLVCSVVVNVANTIILLTVYMGPLISIMRFLKLEFISKMYSYSGKDIKDHLTEISIPILMATISSVIAHLIAVLLGMYIFFAIDIPINMLCVMLMAPYFPKDTFRTICCGLIQCIELVDECCSETFSNFSGCQTSGRRVL